MSRLEALLRRTASELESLGTRWALVGGLAVSIRAEPRFTRDIDIAVSVADDREAESLVATHLERGYTVLASVEQEASGRLATTRLRMPDTDAEEVVLDLLFASSGIEPEIVAASEIVEGFDGLAVPVAATGHLIATKLLAQDERTRPLDLADLRALLGAAAPADLDLARDAVRLIAARGYSRGRDLEADLERALSGR